MIFNRAMVIIILLIIIIIILVTCYVIAYSKNKRLLLHGMIIVSLMIAIVVITPIHEDIPAIEVYRGNTTLEITYRDSIPIDSVVVYKKDKK